jgi:hypothetical protein
MGNVIIIGKIDLSVFDKRKAAIKNKHTTMENPTIKAWDEMYSNFPDENTIGDMLESRTEEEEEEMYDDDDTSFLGEFAYQITDPKF